jgi:hypothetical protein
MLDILIVFVEDVAKQVYPEFSPETAQLPELTVKSYGKVKLTE